MNTYTQAQIVYAPGLFTDINGNPVDPVVVEFVYDCTNLASPVRNNYTGLSGIGNVQKLSTGSYVFQINTNILLGYLVWEWFGSGGYTGINSDSAIVVPQPI
jgi:hypothetical protein